MQITMRQTISMTIRKTSKVHYLSQILNTLNIDFSLKMGDQHVDKLFKENLSSD
jgi:hypothetical protein